MAGGGTTEGGAFRFPYQFADIVDTIRDRIVEAAPDLEPELDSFISMYMDRDRALEDFSTYAAGGASAMLFDAIVDSSLDASDETERHFRGIGEAIEYMDGVLPANQSIQIGVRKITSGTVSTNMYEEDQAVNVSSRTISIVGLGEPVSQQTNQGEVVSVQWDLNNVAFSVPTLAIANMNIINTGGATTFGSVTTLWMRNCRLVGKVAAGQVFADSSHFTSAPNTINSCLYHRCRIATDGNSSFAPGASNKSYFINTTIGSVTAVHSWTITPSNANYLFYMDNGPGGVGTEGGIGEVWSPSISIAARCTVWIRSMTRDNGVLTALSLTDPDFAFVEGRFQSITRTNSVANGRLKVVGMADTIDIAGPAHLDISLGGSSGPILRGSAIRASLQQRFTGSSGTGLQLIGVDDSLIDLTSVWAGSGSTAKPLSIDANSDRTIVNLTGDGSGWPVAAANSSATSIIRTYTASGPPSGAAGGDLSGTYPNPTVTNLIPKTLLDAKGDLIAASAADTAARLAVGADGTHLVAASGETTGLKWEAMPVTKYAVDIGDGVATSFVVNHALNSQDVHVQVREAGGTLLYVTPASIAATDANNVTVTFAVAPTASQYRVIVQS